MARRPRARLLAMPVDGPFPSYSKPLFQGEAKCEAIDIKMMFHFHANVAWGLSPSWIGHAQFIRPTTRVTVVLV